MDHTDSTEQDRRMVMASRQATHQEHQHSTYPAAMEKTHEGMSVQEHESMLLENHKKFLCTYYTNLLLGV